MALAHWKKLTSLELFRNPWWTYRMDTVELPGGREGEYHYVHTGGSVMLVPVRSDGRILLVRQFRYLDGRVSLEFPAGGVREGEDPASIAHKELVEETGHDGAIEYIGYFNPCNGIVDENTRVYLARDLSPSTRYRKDDTEEFEVVSVSADEIDAAIRQNDIYDGMTMAAWAMARGRLFCL
ncbi:MAG: NUDIX hydrolase [Spirochaetes bacterium]|jgi:ADP-ribose pyrophosphatase|nr:NUDIX hydrolase [Spirochaetota bacterium]